MCGAISTQDVASSPKNHIDNFSVKTNSAIVKSFS